MKHYTEFESSLGTIRLVAEEGALSGIYFVGQKYEGFVEKEWIESANAKPFPAVIKVLKAYFDGKTPKFDLPLGAQGTPFQQKVWQQIAAIPYGETITYTQLAERCGLPNGARAAASATGRNPISLIVPCHRVMGSDGSLRGYAGGLDRKQYLLDLERGCVSAHR